MAAALSLLLVCVDPACLGQTPAGVETHFTQVHPPVKDALERSNGQERAVVLIHGIRIHPFNSTKAGEAIFHDWQKAGSSLVRSLGKDADVFAYAYGQTAALETIAGSPAFSRKVAKLRFMGYKEIILVGHSAGGVLARLFVEDHPDSGVTRVIQVCAPNDGSSLASATFSVCKDQEPFLQSLTKKERSKQWALRLEKTIPEKVEFCCLVGVAGTNGDVMVSCQSQWPGDLQKQGIPACRLSTSHFTVMRTPKTIEKIAEAVRERHPRWSAETVEKMRKIVLEERSK
ncbi:MAG: hypothetical protein HY040_13365 [Planctomycetes bacterium]|nr:hypothetical protein [Planctomycetota bacterium]